MNKPERSYMVMDGQWGSTGKGLLNGYLAEQWQPDTVVCNFGPNAGHTFVMEDGRKVITKMLPSAIIAPSVEVVLIGPGAVVDPDIFLAEVKEFADLLDGKVIRIHPRAAIVLEHHRADERMQLKRISSTQKGTGAAQVAKVMREEGAIAEDCLALQSFVTDQCGFQMLLKTAKILQIESAQGFELGVSSGSHYPYCTGRDITPAQIMSDCGVPHWWNPEVYVTMRAHPIRVGHEYDEAGEKVGDSGPVHPDQVELEWDKIELAPEPETTTVTGKIRRVFSFSDIGLKKVLLHCRPDGVFLNFVNYLTEAGQAEMVARIEQVARELDPVKWEYGLIRWLGEGPKGSDVVPMARETYEAISTDDCVDCPVKDKC